jgi:CRISPR-associated protein (TIGR02710 family)
MNSQDHKMVLVATVGGSPAPIAAALKILRPDVVYFIVSKSETGSVGSANMVNSPEINYGTIDNPITGPGLRGVDGCPPHVGAPIEVPADDPDRVFAQCSELLGMVQRSHPDSRIIVDYTGGTKSMTGGLLMAALGRKGVMVQFMSGLRPDLTQVRAGTEKPKQMSADFVMALREFDRMEALMAAFDYGAALLVAENLEKWLLRNPGTPKRAKRKLEQAKKFLTILDLWDRFDIVNAGQRARDDDENGGDVARALDGLGLLQPLRAFANGDRSQATWSLCADLWLNTQRCAARGRYDDAIARVYRLTEAAVQAELWDRHKIQSPPPWDKVPDEFKAGIRVINSGQHPRKYKAAPLGLDRSFQFALSLEPTGRFAKALSSGLNEHGGPPWTARRNNSILAHGFSPLGRDQWIECEKWVSKHLRSLWLEYEHPQLPREFPDSMKLAG